MRSTVEFFFSASAAAQPKVPALQIATMTSEALSARAVKGSSCRTKASHRSETPRKTSGCGTHRVHQWAMLCVDIADINYNVKRCSSHCS